MIEVVLNDRLVRLSPCQLPSARSLNCELMVSRRARRSALSASAFMLTVTSCTGLLCSAFASAPALWVQLPGGNEAFSHCFSKRLLRSVLRSAQ